MTLYAALLITIINAARLDRNGTVVLSNDQTPTITPNENNCNASNAFACGYFQDSLNVTGWGILEIQTINNIGNI